MPFLKEMLKRDHGYELDLPDHHPEYYKFIGDRFYYLIHIESNIFGAYHVSNIYNGPIKKIYELDGVADIEIIANDSIYVYYHIPFFLQDNLFNSIATMDKFKL